MLYILLYRSSDDDAVTIIITLILLTLRILITVFCVNRAKKLNRDTGGWGIFGFFFPLIAFIWILCLETKYILKCKHCGFVMQSKIPNVEFCRRCFKDNEGKTKNDYSTISTANVKVPTKEELEKLNEIGQLRKNGMITEGEYLTIKKKILEE